MALAIGVDIEMVGVDAGLGCYLCGRKVKDKGLRHWIHLGEGGFHLLAAGERSENGQDEDGEGGQGYFQVGPECVQRLPPPREAGA